MDTAEKTSDKDAILDRIQGKPIDPEAHRRIREKGEKVTEELRKKFGEMNIAVDLIHEVRDGA